MFDFLKKSISSSPLGQAYTTAKNLVTSATKPTPTPKVEGPVGYTPYTPPQTPVQAPKLPTTPSNVQTGGITQDQITQQRIDNKFTDTFTTQPKTTVSADTLAPDNTLSSLKQARKQLEDQYLKGLTPTDSVSKLADIQEEKDRLTEKYYKEYKDLKKNPEGMFGGALDAKLRDVKERQNEQLGFLAMQEATALGIVNLEKDQQNDVLKNIKDITALTQSDMVGGLQTDEVTGEITGFFKDPETGQITQQSLGTSTPKQNLTYEKVGGQLVAIDKNTGNIVKTYGDGAGNSIEFANNVDAYAAQYAQDGVKPTSIPEGITFGMIADRAAAMPKFPGQLVSKSTGVTPKNVSAEYVKGISLMSDIVQNTLPRMATLYPKLITGGKLNPFTTKERQEYNTIRQEFLSKLVQARSGAAVSEQEYARYEALLPKNLDQLTGTGIKKLDSLTSTMKTDLDTKLNTSNLSIYGYSPVNIEGQEYKVGDLLDINGTQFRVEPDGNLRPQGDFSSAGNASASNVPQRNNNPGNIKSGGLADKYATGRDSQGHLIFPDAQTGFRAMEEDISAKINGQSQYLPANPTVAQLGKVYAEDPNWGASVARILGVSPSTPTQTISLPALTKAIAQQEGFYA